MELDQKVIGISASGKGFEGILVYIRTVIPCVHITNELPLEKSLVLHKSHFRAIKVIQVALGQIHIIP